jgi:hypothetical protein
MGWAWSVVSLLLLAVMLNVSVADARHLKVYSPYELEGGELEVAYWFDAFINTPIPDSGRFPRQHLLRHTAELAYGLTDHWYAGIYADFEQPTREGAERFTFVQYRLETIYRIINQSRYWPAVGLYLEYVVPRESYEDRDEIEFKVLLERRTRDFMIRVNPVVEHHLNEGSRVQFGYETGVYWFLKAAVRLGIEGFGNFGPLGSFPTTNLQRHSWGPAVKFKLGKVGWDLGMQFGWTDRSDYVVFKSILDYEF